MVAPYEVGDPVRSYVRVPGVGKNQGTKALCWDLSRSSLLAAAVPVQPSLPPQDTPVALLKPEEEPSTQEEAGFSPSPLTVTGQQHSIPSDAMESPEAEPAETNTRKRCREDQATQSDVRVEPASKVARVADKAEGSSSAQAPSTVVPLQPQPDYEVEVKQLKQKCEDLHKENQDLHRRLALFHDLFKNKRRLASFVRHLDTLVK